MARPPHMLEEPPPDFVFPAVNRTFERIIRVKTAKSAPELEIQTVSNGLTHHLPDLLEERRHLRFLALFSGAPPALAPKYPLCGFVKSFPRTFP